MGNIVKKFFLLLLIISYGTSLHAQKDMIPGYVVTTLKKTETFDTLRGFIRERSNWSRPYIDFARTADGPTEQIPIAGVKMFYLKTYDAYYYVAMLDLDKKPRETSNLEPTPGRRIVFDTVLLHLVVRGTVNLYEYKDETDKQHFFVRKKTEPIQELDYVRFKKDVKFVEMRFYVETLRSMLADCDKVKTTDVRYDEKSFAKAINEYNSCFSTSNYTAENVGTKVRIGVFAGSGPTTVHFKGNDRKASQDANAPDSKFSNTTSIFGGLSVEMMSKSAVSRMIPAFNIMYQKTGTSTASNQNLVSKIDLTSKFSFLHTGFGVKLLLNQRHNIKFYLKGNGNLAFLVNHQTSYISTNLYTHEVSKPAVFAIPKKLGFSAGGGAGVSFGRLDAEINYLTNLVSTDAAPQCQLGTVYLAIALRFIN